jgi:glycosyltransferase involved in cell wall biosynthesis
MSARPLVSVIIPTHNRATVLPKALDSVYAQQGIGKQFDLEVIVVDDASTDTTPTVVQHSYAAARYIRLTKNRGLAGARNAGLVVTQGAFVAFLDDDDVWLPHRLQVQLPVLERHPEAGAVYSQVYYPSSHNPAGKKKYPDLSQARSGQIFTSLLAGNFMAVHSVLVRRHVFAKTGYFDEDLSLSEDWDMWLRLSFHFPFLFLPEAVAVYNASTDGMWKGASRARQEENCTRIIEKALQMLPDSPAHVELKRTTRARVALTYARTWEKVLAVLRAHPDIVCHNWAQRYVRLWVRKQSLETESSVSTAQELCAQVKAAIPHKRLKERWGLRKMVAEIWADIAHSLASDSQARQRDAAHAAARAVAHLPSYGLHVTLMRMIFRGAIAKSR